MLIDEILFRKDGYEKSGVTSFYSCLNSINMTSIYTYTYALLFGLSFFYKTPSFMAIRSNNRIPTIAN